MIRIEKNLSTLLLQKQVAEAQQFALDMESGDCFAEAELLDADMPIIKKKRTDNDDYKGINLFQVKTKPKKKC